MAIHTDAEPLPRSVGDRPGILFAPPGVDPLPSHVHVTPIDFFNVLASRRSRVGDRVPPALLSSLLWHVTQLRERRFDGRFGQWESRPGPSAGGIHPIRLMTIPLDTNDDVGIYDDAVHSMARPPRDASETIRLNAASVSELTGAVAGTTVQFLADPTRLAACYVNHETLLWRDAGAMTAILCLTAEALGLTAVPLGRHGDEIVQSCGLPARVKGVGAVHIGSRPPADQGIADPARDHSGR